MRQGRQILIIEDDPDYRLIIRRWLIPVWEVFEARTLTDGITWCLGHQIDCVLLDLNLPDSSRDKSLAHFFQAVPQAVVVVISGDSDPALIRKLIHDGASAYLVKGKDDLDPSSLVRVIETAITNHAVLNKLDMAAIDTQSIRKEIGQ
jgi:DNA-binding NarL/FixJ family response regulator